MTKPEDSAATSRGRIGPRLAVVAALAAVVVLGALLRLASAGDPDGRWYGDAAFHDRMIRATVELGRVPAVDSLSEAPRGRRTADYLPLGLYVTAAGFHRLMAAFGRHDIDPNARVFVALAAALVALPVFAATRAVFGDRRAALLAALIAVVLPAHVHRTWCWWLRYEPLGVTLIMAHLAAGLGALTARETRPRMVYGILSGTWLLAAVWVWRVALMIPLLDAGFVALWAVVRPCGREVRAWFTAIVVAESLAAFAIGYQRHETFFLSGGWVFAVGLCAALHSPWLRSDAATARARALGVGAAALVAVILGAVAGRERQYAVMLHVLWAKLTGAASTAAAGDPFTALSLGVDELSGSAPGEWLGPGMLSWLGAWMVLTPVLLWWRAGRPPLARLRDARPAGALLAFLLVTLLAVTMMLTRTKVMLAPLVAVVCGGSLVALTSSPVAAAAPRRSRRGRGDDRPAARGSARWGRRTLAVVLLACLGMTIRDGVWLATTRRSHLDAGLTASLEYLRSRTPPRASVLSLWERGYEIQTYAGRRTLVDGLLESPVVKRRVIEIDRAWMQASPESLAALCRRDGAGWLLVPPSTSLLGVALVTRPPFLEKLLQPGVPLTPQEADRVLVRMMVLGGSIPPFELAFERDAYRVYRLAPAAAPPP